MSNVANPVAATTSAANLLGQQNYDDLTLFDRKDLSTISIIDDLNNAQETVSSARSTNNKQNFLFFQIKE